MHMPQTDAAVQWVTCLRSWALPQKLPIVQQLRKLPAILRNPKVHHRVHKSPPLVPILSQFDPVHIISSYLSKIHFNIVQPPTSPVGNTPAYYSGGSKFKSWSNPNWRLWWVPRSKSRDIISNQAVTAERGRLINLWLYHKNNKLRDWKKSIYSTYSPTSLF
jgi:hypothetical protein